MIGTQPKKNVVSNGLPNGRARVLIVDDHPAIRDALTMMIARQMGMEVCGDASSASEALLLLEKLHPDAAIVDISLSDTHGLDLVEQIRNRYPDISVVVFSMYDENVYAERALRSGASAYVMKSESTKTVIEALRTALRGDIYLSRSISTRLLMRSVSNHGSDRGAGLEELTDREMAVFQMVGEGFSVEEISQRLHITRKTTEHYRRRIKDKLSLRSINELVQFAVRWTHGHSEHNGRNGHSKN